MRITSPLTLLLVVLADHRMRTGNRRSDDGDSVTFHPLGRLSTADVEAVIEDGMARMTSYLRRRGLLDDARDAEDMESDSEASGLAALAATAASGMSPPGVPAFRRGALRSGSRVGPTAWCASR